jgi:replication initiator protein RepSA
MTIAVPTIDAARARPGSRAARMLHPRSVDVVKDLAVEHGICPRPVSLRRTDLDTGHTQLVDLPCGATREDICPACARRAARLRRQQIREGWHRTDEPLPPPDPASDQQVGLVILRAHLEYHRAETLLRPMDPDTRAAEITDIDTEVAALEEEITLTGLRGRPAPGDGRRVRSTRRRQDAPNLPRRTIEPRTTGRIYEAPDGTSWRPSLFLTLTLPSYGRVRHDGTPVNPDTYDYRAAAWDAVHFPRLLDRFWQNLRRAEGWNIQYAGTIEPQRRLAPHAHFAIRGTISRTRLRQVAAATYHQVWWPPATERRYQPDHPPVWNPETSGFVDPDTGQPLTTWPEALDALDTNPEAQPAHVVRFGTQLHAQGVIAGSPESSRCLGYLTKYLTKHVADCHPAHTGRQRAHLERLWEQLRRTPCSPRCDNWLLYGIQPDHDHAKLTPGRCRARVHQRATLGLGGRRVLISRQWSGKTLADHRADNYAWVRTLLGHTTDHPGASRHAWELARPGDPDLPPLGFRLLRTISERIQQRAQLDSARRPASAPPISRDRKG